MPSTIIGPGTVSGYSLASSGGGGGDSTVTPPSPTSQSVASGVNLSAVTFGAFTDPDGIIASYQLVTTNATGGASWSGSGLGAYTPSSSAGDSGTISLNAKDTAGNIVATALHTYDRASSGGLTDVLNLDFTDVTTTGGVALGDNTIAFEGSDTTVEAYWTRISGGNGTVTPTNGVGLVFDGGSDTSSLNTLSFDLDPLFASYTASDVRTYQYVVHVVMTNLVYPSSNNSLFLIGLNRGTTATHNQGIARMIYVEDAGDGVNEETRARKNTSNSAIQSTTAIKTSRVISLILTQGAIVQVMDTAGTTPPTPLPGAASTLMIGSDAVGLAVVNSAYQQNGLRCFVTSGDTADFTITRILVQRF